MEVMSVYAKRNNVRITAELEKLLDEGWKILSKLSITDELRRQQ